MKGVILFLSAIALTTPAQAQQAAPASGVIDWSKPVIVDAPIPLQKTDDARVKEFKAEDFGTNSTVADEFVRSLSVTSERPCKPANASEARCMPDKAPVTGETDQADVVPQQPPTGLVLSPEARAVVGLWRAEVQKALDRAEANPSTSFADQLNQRVAIEQVGRDAIGLVRSADLQHEQMTLAIDEIWKEVERRDVENNAWLKENLPPDGWFRISRDGARTANNAWLIVQHSPDRDWQASVLARMTSLAAENEVDGRDYALLYDRVEMFAGRPQRFGSQGTCRNGKVVIDALENPERVDEFRASVGLGTFEDYKVRLGVGADC